MSGLALVLSKRGYSVSGSDRIYNPSIRNLERIGVTLFKKQESSNIEKLIKENKIYNDELIIVISTAIPKENAELICSYKNKLKILHRSDVLAFLIKKQKSILIAGSHGKTTTSTIIATLMAKNSQDPTAIIGGIIPYYESNAYSGKGEFIIAEIDESDGSISKYSGNISILTNLELDHTDHYKDLEDLKKSIHIFIEQSNHIIANFDCPNLRQCIQSKAIWWSTKNFKDVDYSAIPIEMNGERTIAKYYEKGNLIDKILINLPGEHNLNNILGAISACRQTGIPFNKLKKSLCSLERPQRRFEFKGNWKGRIIVDDYAHHPSEIRETIRMARLIINSKKSNLPNKPERLVVIFQPHRYSRLRDLMLDFANYLGAADFLIIAPIYSAGEKAIKNVNIDILKSFILKKYPKLSISLSGSLTKIIDILQEKTYENDLILIMGAGDITQLSDNLINNELKINI
ncbi:UDP-N-acetylmuramate--alanine ligase [Prochlorococcus sp. MIT 0602]|nr:UDP-N-acetylmuramate--alanine ligase [Prochlorococcus sp. MIT 0602]KGG18097.1 UDP-N-acetylmuramate--alanine ligase [Prochlorococcus sp. MIT 0603]